MAPTALDIVSRVVFLIELGWVAFTAFMLSLKPPMVFMSQPNLISFLGMASSCHVKVAVYQVGVANQSELSTWTTTHPKTVHSLYEQWRTHRQVYTF